MAEWRFEMLLTGELEDRGIKIRFWIIIRNYLVLAECSREATEGMKPWKRDMLSERGGH